MTLTGKQYEDLDSLSRIFLDSFRASLPSCDAREHVTDRLQITVPARSSAVGPLEIMLDGDEVTVYLGEHTHCHFSTYMYEENRPREAERQACAAALEFIGEVLADRVVIWSRRVGDRITSGGTYALGGTQSMVDQGAERLLWSGARVGP